jgi:Response regulator containing a CheY-like receiver domain and a GGDEF domain
MIQPLALVLYERLLPGSRLVNLLQDLKYRVQTLADAGMLVECAEQVKPMLLIVDLESARSNVTQAIAKLRQNAATQHIPVIAFGGEASKLKEDAKEAGVTLIVDETALLSHLPIFLEQALQVE